MAKKSLFKKRKKFNYNKYFILGFIIIIIILFFYYYPNQAYFEIPDFNDEPTPGKAHYDPDKILFGCCFIVYEKS